MVRKRRLRLWLSCRIYHRIEVMDMQADRNKVISAIWAMGNKLGMDSEDIHAVVERETGKNSMRKCTDKQLAKVLDAMKLIGGMEQQRRGGITDKQLHYIAILEHELGWYDNPERLRGFVKKMCNVEHVKWLTIKQASNVIEGMKALLKRESQNRAVE